MDYELVVVTFSCERVFKKKTIMFFTFLTILWQKMYIWIFNSFKAYFGTITESTCMFINGLIEHTAISLSVLIIIWWQYYA